MAIGSETLKRRSLSTHQSLGGKEKVESTIRREAVLNLDPPSTLISPTILLQQRFPHAARLTRHVDHEWWRFHFSLPYHITHSSPSTRPIPHFPLVINKLKLQIQLRSVGFSKCRISRQAGPGIRVPRPIDNGDHSIAQTT